MNKIISAFALSAFMSVPILSYAAEQSGINQGKKSDELFSYVITNPAEDSETFWSIDLQFPNAASVKFLPNFF